MPNVIPMDIVIWGFPLTFLAEIPSLDPLRKSIGSCIGNSQTPEASDLSEISAAALVKALGARRLENIKRADSDTPDFHVWWEEDLVEIEVTKAIRKETLLFSVLNCIDSHLNRSVRYDLEWCWSVRRQFVFVLEAN